MSEQRKFPPPWSVEKMPGGLKVCDASGQSTRMSIRAPLHSTQTQLLLLHAPVDPHWASVTQSRQWWLTHERPDGQDASVVHLTFSQCPPTQPPRVQSLSALHDGLWHDPLMHRASDWCTPGRHYSSLADSGRTRLPRRRRCNWSRRYMSIALGRRRGRSPWRRSQRANP
jgi:hypothetical protein